MKKQHQCETPNEIDHHKNNDTDDISIDQELAEDQAVIDQKQNMIGDALPSVVEIDNMENTIFQCAQVKITFLNMFCWMKILRY